MQIRKAHRDDVNKILDFFKCLDAETEFMLFEKGERKACTQQQIEKIERFNQSADEQMFIGIDDQQILGFVVVTMKPFHKVKHCFQLVIGVLKEAQGFGLAKQLFNAAEFWAIEAGSKRIELTVMSQNIRAIHFYEKMGFEKEGVRRNSILLNGEFVDEFYMAKTW